MRYLKCWVATLHDTCNSKRRIYIIESVLSLSLNQPSKVQNSFPNISPSERDLSFYFIMFTRGSGGGCAIFGLMSFYGWEWRLCEILRRVQCWSRGELCKINGGDETWWWLLLLILLIPVDGIVYTRTLKKSTKVTLRPLWISSVEVLMVDLCGCKTYVELNHW